MFKLLNEEIEKDFNKAENFNTIMSKIEGENSMKKFNIKYVLVPTFTIVLVIVALSVVLIMQTGNGLIANANTPLGNISNANRNEKKDDIIHINSFKNYIEGSKATIPKEADLYSEYSFLEKLYISAGLELMWQNKIYIRDIKNLENLIFLENAIEFVTDEYDLSRVAIYFGPNKILGSYDILVPDKTPQISIISNVDVEIYAKTYNNDKIFGEANFKHNGMNFKIEFRKIHKDDLVKTIKSIIDNCN